MAFLPMLLLSIAVIIVGAIHTSHGNLHGSMFEGLLIILLAVLAVVFTFVKV